jgi:RND superfamily putative drug exporter
MIAFTRWTIAHRWLVIVAWIAAAAGLVMVSQSVGFRTSNNFALPNTDSQRAADLLKSRFPAQAGDADQIVFRVRTGTIRDASARAVIIPMLGRIAKLPHVTGVVSPYQTGAGAISMKGKIGFATVQFDQSSHDLPHAAVTKVIKTAESIRSSALQVELGGDAISEAQSPSLGYATFVGLGAAIVVLLLTFGSLLATALPIVTALLGLGASIGVIALTSHLVDMTSTASTLGLMIGLAVGIDYSLFIVTRYRAAYRDNGGDVDAAVELAMNTSGRAILFAGTTIVIAMLSLFALGVSALYGSAIAASLAVLFVLAASLTLLPGLLKLSGHRLGRTRSRPQQREPRSGFWIRWVGLIQRRPAWAALAATALLLVLAAPFLGLRLGQPDAGNDPQSQTTRRAYDLLATGFGKGFNEPLLLAVRLPKAGDTAALTPIATTLRHTDGVASLATPQLNPARDTAAITVYPTSSPQSTQTVNLVKRLRAQVLPTLQQATRTTMHVGGFTAAQIDYAHALSSKLPLFIAIVVLLSAALLLVVFRSLLIPLQAALMNLLSIAAALGVVVAIFEHHWFTSLTGIEPAPITSIIPVTMFAIVFGLSMDYEVFLISRIHEEWQHRHDPNAAIRKGITTTARVITAAAAVMIAVFVSVGLGGSRDLELAGIALAVAVFLDAFVIRTILLPAVLFLLGRHAWYLPARLNRRLPRLAIEPPTKPPTPLEEAA